MKTNLIFTEIFLYIGGKMSKIVDLFDEACERYSERSAFFDFSGTGFFGGGFRKKSFEELKFDVERVQANLLEKGMQKDQRVIIFVTPSYKLLVFMMACMRMGISLMVIDMWAGKELICKVFEQYRADYIAVGKRTKLLRFAFPGIREVKNIILMEEIFGKVPTKIPEKTQILENQVAVLTMTTGSTGNPKIVLRSHRDLHHQLELVRNNMEQRIGETIALNTSFMYHFVNVLNGYSSVLLPLGQRRILRFFYQRKLKKVEELGIQVLFTTPDFCFETKNLFPKLEELYVGGAILNLHEAQKIRDKFPNAEISYIYGATECNLITVTNLNDYIKSLKEEHKTILGKAVKGVNIKTDDDEIMVNADVILSDYLNPENQRGEFDEEGRYWHKTGDAGRLENGVLHYLGRRDVFVRGRDKDLFSNVLEQEIVLTFAEVKKCAFFYHNGRNYLFVEGDFYDEKALQIFAKSRGIEKVIIRLGTVIPCDAKHHTKINYNQLKAMTERLNDNSK